MEPYVVLARKYRPGSFEEVLGQETIARTLAHAIETGRVAHAYLFAGPRGVGKTSLARILARALCCVAGDGPTVTPCGECEVCCAVAQGDDLDVIEIDGASNRGIDEMRTLRDNARFAPARARYKIYLIDEVHMLTDPAFNALLKILEEPPAHVKFMFATTDPEKVPATILSRCQRFDFRRIPTRTIAEHLKKICEAEGVEAPGDVILTVAASSAGGMRDAQSLLDQLITLGGGRLVAEDLEGLLGTVSARSLVKLFKAVGEGDAGRAVELYERSYEQGVEAAEFLKQVLSLVRDLLVIQTCGAETDLLDVTPEAMQVRVKLAEIWGRPRVLYALGLLAETLKTVKLVGEGRALVELALVKLAEAERLRSLDEILGDLEELRASLPSPASPRAPSRAPAPVPAPVEAKRGGALFENARLSPEETGEAMTLERARAGWDEIRSRVDERNPATASYLSVGRILGLTDDTLLVGFPPSARFHRRQLEDPERISLVEEVVAGVLGAGLRLRTEVSEEVEEKEAVPAAEAPGEEIPSRVTREEIDKIGRLPIVNALKDVLMARLIHMERT